MWRASCRRRKQQCDEARTEKLLNCSSIHVPPSADYSLPSHYYNEDGPVLLNGFRDDSFLRGRAVPDNEKTHRLGCPAGELFCSSDTASSVDGVPSVGELFCSLF